MRIDRVLRAAASRLRARGWDGTTYNGITIAEALYAVANNPLDESKAKWFLQEELLQGMYVGKFEINEMQTIDEALAFLKLGAELATAEGL